MCRQGLILEGFSLISTVVLHLYVALVRSISQNEYILISKPPLPNTFQTSKRGFANDFCYFPKQKIIPIFRNDWAWTLNLSLSIHHKTAPVIFHILCDSTDAFEKRLSKSVHHSFCSTVSCPSLWQQAFQPCLSSAAAVWNFHLFSVQTPLSYDSARLKHNETLCGQRSYRVISALFRWKPRAHRTVLNSLTKKCQWWTDMIRELNSSDWEKSDGGLQRGRWGD